MKPGEWQILVSVKLFVLSCRAVGNAVSALLQLNVPLFEIKITFFIFCSIDVFVCFVCVLRGPFVQSGLRIIVLPQSCSVESSPVVIKTWFKLAS